MLVFCERCVAEVQVEVEVEAEFEAEGAKGLTNQKWIKLYSSSLRDLCSRNLRSTTDWYFLDSQTLDHLDNLKKEKSRTNR